MPSDRSPSAVSLVLAILLVPLALLATGAQRGARPGADAAVQDQVRHLEAQVRSLGNELAQLKKLVKQSDVNVALLPDDQQFEIKVREVMKVEIKKLGIHDALFQNHDDRIRTNKDKIAALGGSASAASGDLEARIDAVEAMATKTKADLKNLIDLPGSGGTMKVKIKQLFNAYQNETLDSYGGGYCFRARSC